MDEKAAVFFKVCASDGLAPRMLRIQWSGPQDDVVAVERAIALANRHRRLARIVPDGGKAIRFGIEAGDSSAGALRSIRIEEGEIRLQELAVLDHVLLTRPFCHNRFAVHREEGFNDVPVARELREQFLTSAGGVRWLVLIVGLLRDCRGGNKQSRSNPFPHGT